MNDKNLLSRLRRAKALEEEGAPDPDELGFTYRGLVQATLPHRDPGDVLLFGRENGGFSLVIQQGSYIKDGKIIKVGYPYGSIPRLIIAFLTREALRTESPVLELGLSLSQFMAELGLVPTGGRWGSITRLREQMRRLFCASISLYYDGSDGFAKANLSITDKSQFWWNPQHPEQAGLWHSKVTLGQFFFQELLAHPVPIDLRVIRELKASPLALDIYCWLTYRMSYLKRSTFIPWKSLERQFGAEYTRTRAFKEKFLKQLYQVRAFYSHARLLPLSDKGLTLLPSQPHILPKPKEV